MLDVIPLQALLMDFLDTPEKRERRLVHLPMGRFGEPIELARAALFCEFYFCSTGFALLRLFQDNWVCHIV
jgi:NAD(P)-dependent dehydrogenase (short-subunit alcohol dehydrogenase family)